MGLKICFTLEKVLNLAFDLTEFDQTLNNVKIEKISIFLEQHEPRFEFYSKSCNYFIPKQENSRVIGERNSM